MENEEENENDDEPQDYTVSEFTENLLVIVAEDNTDNTKYIIGAKCEM